MGLLISAGTLLFSDDLALFKSKTRYFASFGSAAGLHEGAPLRMGGVDIGSVESVTIDSTSGTTRIVLSLVVYAPHDELIKTDSEASLDTQGMLGDKYLKLTPGSAGAPLVPENGFIRTRENTEISAVVSESTAIIKTVKDTTTKIDAFVDSLPPGDALKSVALDFQASARELRSLLTAMNAEGSGIRRAADPETSERLDRLLTILEGTATHLESVAAKIDGGKGTLGALVNDATLYDDMRKLMGRANRSKAAKYIIQQVMSEGDAAVADGEKGAEADAH
jgi:phospholipid/cholesterol/gamma-HCH transport system substrate-binding protein